MKKVKKIKTFNIIFGISAIILITSIIAGAIFLINKNGYAAICFAGTFCSLILCTISLKELDKIEAPENYYCREYLEEIGYYSEEK